VSHANAILRLGQTLAKTMHMPEAAGQQSRLRALLSDRRTWYLALFVIAAFLGTRKLIGRYTDLQIWLDISREIYTNLDIYRYRGFGKAPFIWPHVVALFLYGGTSLLSNDGFTVVFGISQGLATVLLIYSLTRLVEAQRKLDTRTWVIVWVLFALTIGRAIDQSFMHGQIALWTGALITYGVLALIERRSIRAGVVFAIATVCKMTPLLFLPGLIVMGARRAAVSMGVALVALVFLVPWPFLGTELHERHLHDFYAASIRPLWTPKARIHDYWQQGDHNIRGTLTTLLRDQDVPGELPMPTIVDLPADVVNVITLVYSLVIGLLLLWGVWRFRRGPPAVRYAWQASFVMLAMVFFSPATHLYHMAGITLPVMLFLTSGPGVGLRKVFFVAICAGMACATSLRQESILGEFLWNWLHHAGVLHFSLVAMLIWLVTLPRSGLAEARQAIGVADSRAPSPARGAVV